MGWIWSAERPSPAKSRRLSSLSNDLLLRRWQRRVVDIHSEAAGMQTLIRRSYGVWVIVKLSLMSWGSVRTIEVKLNSMCRGIRDKPLDVRRK